MTAKEALEISKTSVINSGKLEESIKNIEAEILDRDKKGFTDQNVVLKDVLLSNNTSIEFNWFCRHFSDLGYKVYNNTETVTICWNQWHQTNQ